MTVNRRQLLASLTVGLAWGATRCGGGTQIDTGAAQAGPRPIRQPDGGVDWRAVRNLFPLAADWTHLASFLLVSHPKPVAEAIEHFRRKIDADPPWIEQAAFSDGEGRPFAAVKRALADYVGGTPQEICLTSNTTGALAMAYHGLRIREGQEILTTEHDHYSHHESIRFAAARSGCGVRYVALYDRPADASATEIAARVARAIRPNTRAVGVTWVHSSTGVKLPITGTALPTRMWMSPGLAAISSPRARTNGSSPLAVRGFCGAAATSGPSCAQRFRRSIRMGCKRGTPG